MRTCPACRRPLRTITVSDLGSGRERTFEACTRCRSFATSAYRNNVRTVPEGSLSEFLSSAHVPSVERRT